MPSNISIADHLDKNKLDILNGSFCGKIFDSFKKICSPLEENYHRFDDRVVLLYINYFLLQLTLLFFFFFLQIQQIQIRLHLFALVSFLLIKQTHKLIT